MKTLVELLQELSMLAVEDRRAFPYEDCRRLITAAGPQYRSFIPDLDYYLSGLAGHRSHGRRIVTWSDERIANTRKKISLAFAARYPAYASILLLVTADAFVDLNDTLVLAERTRIALDTVLAMLEQQRAVGRDHKASQA